MESFGNLTYVIETLGCKVNTADAHRLDCMLQNMGALPLSGSNKPDVCFLFSCTVTNRADSKSRRALRKLAQKYNNSEIVLMGCMAASITEKELLKLPVKYKITPSEQADSIKNVLASISHKTRDCKKNLPESENDINSRTRAFVKVQTGCISFCSYCIIPYVRGPVKSIPRTDIINLVNDLVCRGYKEIVLTGINIGCYGIDMPEKRKRFKKLLEMIAASCSFERLRISSIEPLDADLELLRIMKQDKRICPHLHLPAQSGSNRILKLMKRPYTREKFLEIAGLARSEIPKLNITTDMIAGFPGETDMDHQKSLDLIEKAGITKVHAFPFSPRRGTPAASMGPVIKGDIASARVKELIRAGSVNYDLAALNMAGKIRTVLTEQKQKDEYWKGFSEDYFKTIFKSKSFTGGSNSLAQVRIIEKISNETLLGRYMGPA